MTPHSPKAVTLTPAQIKSIIYNMGWEPEDATTFLRMARLEMKSRPAIATAKKRITSRKIRQDAAH